MIAIVCVFGCGKNDGKNDGKTDGNSGGTSGGKTKLNGEWRAFDRASAKPANIDLSIYEDGTYDVLIEGRQRGEVWSGTWTKISDTKIELSDRQGKKPAELINDNLLKTTIDTYTGEFKRRIPGGS